MCTKAWYPKLANCRNEESTICITGPYEYTLQLVRGGCISSKILVQFKRVPINIDARGKVVLECVNRGKSAQKIENLRRITGRAVVEKIQIPTYGRGIYLVNKRSATVGFCKMSARTIPQSANKNVLQQSGFWQVVDRRRCTFPLP